MGLQAHTGGRFERHIFSAFFSVLLFLAAWSTGVAGLGSSCGANSLGGGTAGAGDPYWMQSITRRGTSAFNANPGSYKVYRNVKDYGAAGDGSTDDTAAINNAISDGSRCGNGCHSSTVVPALVYFPPGNYVVSTPIIPYYYTSLVGDFKNRPTLIASVGFTGIAVIDADPYIPGGGGAEWYVNQNNFFRSVRNIKIDTTKMPASAYGTGLHWQVAQATSLINVHVEMSQASGNKHQGIFMENGSGGFMADLSFNGGAFGMWISNQQFTVHNVVITNAATGIYQAWNWGWTFRNVAISNCGVGFDLATGGLTQSSQTMGADVIIDSSITSTPIGIRTSTSQKTSLGGSIFLENMQFSGVTSGVIDGSGSVLLAGGSQKIAQWVQGNVYSGTGAQPQYVQEIRNPPTIPPSLLDGSGNIFAKTRPQYENFAPSQFTSVKANGAKGDGVTDDSAAIQAVLDQYWGCSIIYFDAGTYVVTKTINVRTGTIIVGEFWSTILGSGSAFTNANNPTPILKVGNPGDNGQVEISDMVISTVGGSSGAVGIEWNLAGPAGSAGMWDVHVRIGGAKGTGISSSTCPISSTSQSCQGAFLGIHITSKASGYFENVWVWAADHDLDDPAETRINAFSGRGIFVDGTTGPVWLVGTGSEHHALYQYSIVNAQNVYAGLIQTETPYYQPTPAAPNPFSVNAAWNDPSFGNDASAWGLNIAKSCNIFVYGAGLYSFFVNYAQDCLNTYTCQVAITNVDAASGAIYIYSLSTVGTTSMINVGGSAVAAQSDNRNGFASTLTVWSASLTTPPSTTPTYPAPAPCPSVYTVAKAHIDEMQTYFVPIGDGGGGYYVSQPDVAFRLWTDANTWEDLYNYMLATGDDAYDIFNESTFPYPSGNSFPTNLFNDSYDDALWTALMYFKIGDWRGARGQSSAEYYQFAYDIIAFVGATWETTKCGGGVCWDGPCNYKNTITNALFLLTSSIAYQKTGSQSHLDDATKVQAWLSQSGLQDSDGLWMDGSGYNTTTNTCGGPGGTKWSYNQGVIASGHAAFYAASGRTNAGLLTIAERTINATFTDSDLSTGGVLRESCDDATGAIKCTNPDRMTFKGLFMKHLQYYLDQVNDNAKYAMFKDRIWAQYSAIFHYATNSDTEAGTVWYAPNAGGSIFDKYGDQAGVEGILAAAKYGGCQS